jgi:RNA polymerase-binding protein DksA
MTLTREQLDELKRALSERREELEAESHADAEESRGEVFSETAGPVADSGDEATADLIADLESAELGRDLQELKDIDAALARMRDGSYGVCIDCRGEIDPERLRIRPTAIRCFECQRVHEKTFAHPGQATL